MFTLLKFINRSRAQPLKEPDAKASDTFGFLAETEVVCLKACVVEAVEQEVGQIRSPRLPAPSSMRRSAGSTT